MSWRSTHYGGPNDKVRFYEQDWLGSRKRRRVDPEADVQAEREEIKKKIDQLDEDLRELEEGPFGPDSPLMKSLPEKERAIALEALRKYDEEQMRKGEGENERQRLVLEEVFDDELDDALREEFEGMTLEQEDWMSHAAAIRKHSRQVPSLDSVEVVLGDGERPPYVDRFNDCLKQFVVNKSNESLRQQLWKWYRRCKLSAGPNFVRSIPDEAVVLLWESQAQGESTKSTRAARLRTLFSDAAAVDRPQPTSYIPTYIESLHDDGETSEALDLWEAWQGTLESEDLEAYWKLGVRLFAADGNPQRAQDIALAFLSSSQSREPRFLIPVITAWGREPGPNAGAKAWALYLQLKTHLGLDMTMADYDSISIGFLKARRPNLALAVFKDMMVTGQNPAIDSTALYKAALGLAGSLQASSISEEEVNKISLSALTMLPSRFQNRFFYAKWMKKLIGMGEIDSAALVVELMYDMGVRPDGKHLNGIIAGWLREGSPSSREKMERLGWSMIHKRIDTVSSTPCRSSKPRETIRGKLDRRVPPASIETFCILLLQYTRRSDDDMVQHLVRCLDEARIKPNSYFMNHLLYAELRKQDIWTLWGKFEKMSRVVEPDLQTFACLWDCGKVQYDSSRFASFEGFPSARGLHSRMIQWYSRLSERHKATAQEEFSKELYDQIIRCFCLSKDLPGTLVALHSMKTLFHFFPDEATARLLIIQVARMAGIPEGTSIRRLRRLKSTPGSKENIARVHRLLEVLSEEKAAILEDNGLDIEHLDPHEKKQCQLEIMSDMLRVMLSRTSRHMEEDIANAASQMSVLRTDLGSALDEEKESMYI